MTDVLLAHIHIRDFAIIDSVELDLSRGLTVLTGETGAGKSILVDALGLALGDRADSQTVRTGAKRAEITVRFDTDARLDDWLQEQDLDDDGECLVRRVVGADGRSRAYVNGHPVPLHVVRELGKRLVDIHGQHEHQSLTRPRVQRALVDFHGDNGALLETVERAYTEWKAVNEEYLGLLEAREEREARLELLQYQVKELNALGLQRDEWDQLQAEQQLLANSGRLADGAQQTLDGLYEADTGSAQETLGQAARVLDGLVDVDERLAEPKALVAEAEIQISEAAELLRRYLADLDTDPARQAEVDNRIGDIQDLARKHRTDPGALPDRLDELQDQLHGLEDADTRLDELATRAQAARESYVASAGRLSAARRKAAESLGSQVSSVMQQLGMPGGVLVVDVATADAQDDGAYRPEGLDSVEFRVSANPGQTPRRLSKVASGGELSRISLAVQVVAADGNPVSCMVFDEVDTGVGGGVAEIVGKRLRGLAGERQVLCVTHLPQVASQAHHHIRVSKLTDGKTTRTSLTALSDDERVEELARMLGGVEITTRTREHAEEMIERAGES